MSVQGSPENILSLRVRISYADFQVDVQQDFHLAGVTGLFGPSGGGKSTLLRVIAGMERTATGRVIFDGEPWQDSERGIFVPAYRRPVGYVFQDARLFAHRTVEGNLRYAEHRSQAQSDSIQYDEVVSTFDLKALLHRRIDALSGGERQRVAIARTLMTRPRLLLLDEPLAALDIARKGEILPYLETLSSRFGIPAIYVTHAIDEIARLAENVVVLDRGRIKAAGGAAEVLNNPDLRPPGSHFEAGTILETCVIRHSEELHLTYLDFHGQTMIVPVLAHLKVGETVRLLVRAGDVALATSKPVGLSFRNILQGTLIEVVSDPESAFAAVTVEVGGTALRAHLTRHAVEELGLRVGLPVFALVKTASFDHRAPPLA